MYAQNYANKQVAIAGFAVENKAVAAYLAERGAHITVLDNNPDTVVPSKYSSRLGGDSLQALDEFDLIVRTPGMPPRKLEVTDRSKITSSTQLYLEQFRDQTVGITGTKGKGTTSTLLYTMLAAADIPVFLGGNIGRAVFEFMADISHEHVVVLELSSFQLMDVTRSPHWAGVLMVEDDHLDWHSSRNEYLQAKRAITAFQTAQDTVVYYPHSDTTATIVDGSAAQHVPYLEDPGCHVADGYFVIDDTQLVSTDEVALPGPHNLENSAAAITLFWHICQERDLGVDARIKAITQAVASFKGLPHRTEVLDTINDITFVNDSFSASPMATVAALKSFDAPKVLIVGGTDKGADFTELIATISSNGVRQLIIMGEIRTKLAKAVAQSGFNDITVVDNKNMQQIVELAVTYAQTGDVVLLSPGCASFDMFKNFQDRGDQYRQAVAELGHA